MIRNYDELLICIEKVEKQIHKLKKRQHHFIYNLNFTEAKQLLSKEQLLELQILNYIEYYQEKIKGNYLENKLYTTKLSSLKTKYLPKNIANDLLYCIKELNTEYDDLKKDMAIFYNLNRLDDVLVIKEKKKKSNQ
jgi:ribosomal protein S17E